MSDFLPRTLLAPSLDASCRIEKKSEIERKKQKFKVKKFDHKEPNDLYVEESQVKT
jgi:hypothetical protein